MKAKVKPLTEREATALRLVGEGKPTAVFEGTDPTHGGSFRARADLTIVRGAWERGCDFEVEADGFGTGGGTRGDWSALRDSSDKAIDAMLVKGVAFLHRHLSKKPGRLAVRQVCAPEFAALIGKASKAALVDALWNACHLGTDESTEQITTKAARELRIALDARCDRVPVILRNRAAWPIDSDGPGD